MVEGKFTFNNLLCELISFNESKLALLEKIINSTENNILHFAIHPIIIGIQTYMEGIKILSKNCNFMAINLLFRSIFESYINIKFISKDNAMVRAIAFLLYDFDKQKEYIEGVIKDFEETGETERINQLSDIKTCRNKIAEILNKKTEITKKLSENYNFNLNEIINSKWETDLFKKAKDVGELSDYRNFYPYLCSFIHLDIMGLKIVYKLINGKIQISIMETEKEIDRTLGAICSYYLKTLIEVYRIFGIYSENEFECFLEKFDFLNKQNCS